MGFFAETGECGGVGLMGLALHGDLVGGIRYLASSQEYLFGTFFVKFKS